MITVLSYDRIKQCASNQDVLEEMRHFNYARYDSFEGFDCCSVEMLDYENLLLSKGSVLFYLEKERLLCYTSKTEKMKKLFSELTERNAAERILYAFFEELTKNDSIAFDQIEKEILLLEEALISNGKKDCVSEIIDLRKRLMVLKRYYEQLLNVFDMIIQNENQIYEQKIVKLFKLQYRKTERRYQNVLNLMESVTQVKESYEAEVEISLNTTMKVFTVVTTIFLPLTLIVGWYGMNFEMPEYGWERGYLFVTSISVIFVLAGILFFHRKKWF